MRNIFVKHIWVHTLSVLSTLTFTALLAAYFTRGYFVHFFIEYSVTLLKEIVLPTFLPMLIVFIPLIFWTKLKKLKPLFLMLFGIVSALVSVVYFPKMSQGHGVLEVMTYSAVSAIWYGLSYYYLDKKIQIKKPEAL